MQYSRVTGRSRYGLTGHRLNSSLWAQLRKRVRLMGRKSERREGELQGALTFCFNFQIENMDDPCFVMKF